MFMPVLKINMPPIIETCPKISGVTKGATTWADKYIDPCHTSNIAADRIMPIPKVDARCSRQLLWA